MKCLACGKECNNQFCHQCLIIKSKRNFTDDELIAFKNLKNVEISSVKELDNKLFQKNTKIFFKCTNCGKETSGLYKSLKNKTELNCHQCTIEKNNFEKYGVKNVFQTNDCKDKIRKTCNEKYGVNSFLQTDKARESRKQVDINYMNYLIDSRLKQFCSSIELEDANKRRLANTDGTLRYQNVYCTCNVCGLKYTTNARRLQRCPTCYPEDWMNGTSKLEKTIQHYIIENCEFNVMVNVRGIIGNKELDVYIPDIKVAFEIDGDYWHGCNSADPKVFHEIRKHAGDKQALCFEKGIRLITIKECDFLDRPDVFYRFIDDIIKPRQRIFARKCTLKAIDTKTAKNFCEFYHVNGYRQGSIKFGIFYNDELICVAVFGKHPKYKYECIRLCYKTGVDIIGGWAKIVKHFGKPFLHYVNLMYFMGENKTGIGYRFKKNDVILSRNTLQKNTQLYKYCPNINPEMSDIQNCINNGFTAIFDCGNDIRFYNQPN